MNENNSNYVILYYLYVIAHLKKFFSNYVYTYTTAKNGYLSNYAYNINGTTYTYSPTYNDLGQVTSEYNGSAFTSYYTYDSMGRVTEYSVVQGISDIVSNVYSYGTNTTSGSQYTAAQVTHENIGAGGEYAYDYDNFGRVTSITKNGISETTVSYDGQNRLNAVCGDDGTRYLYTYDANNNLTVIGKTNSSGIVQPYITYEYNTKNQLTSYTKNGTTKYYAYDNLGNPTKYGVSSISASDNLSWTMGNKLSSGSYNGNTFSYKYDCNGVRYEKTVNGITTRMYLEGSTVIAEEELNQSGTVAHTKYYIYDQTGIAGMVYDGTTYYFVKNLFGDVVAICNGYGNVEASYTYDFWGNITSGGTNGIGKENPFRYRGYYYDDETGFYYLQTRYYDPEICRFISADNLELLPTLSQMPGLLNLYVYCNNNPVMSTDETGEFSWSSFWTGVQNWFADHWIELVIGTAFIIGGAVVTALTCGAGTTAWAAFGSALLSSIIQVGAGIGTGVLVNGLSNLIQGNDFFDNVGDTIASSYMLGGILSGGSQMLSGGFRFLRAKTGFKGIDCKNFGFMSADKLYYNKPGMTVLRLGSRDGAKLAIDFGRYGIHGHLLKWTIHIPLIPGIIGICKLF